MDNRLAGAVVAFAMLMFVLTLLEFMYILNIHDKMTPMREAVEQCEKSLPRDQHCRIEYMAVPVKGDTQ